MAARPEKFDVCVVGAGPSGAVCAFDLARAGKRVLLLEKKKLPRDKLCGDAICLGAQHHLRRMGVLAALEVEHKVRRAELGGFVSPSGIGFIGNSADVNDGALVVAVKRIWLDEKVARAAERAGASLLDGHAVEHAERASDGWTITAAGRSYHARALVAADGALSRLTQMLGIDTPPPEGICSRSYVKAGTHRVKADGVCYYRRDMVPGYAALFREADGDVSYCCYIIPGGPKTIDDVQTMHKAFLSDDANLRSALGPDAVIEKMRAAPLRLGGTRKTYYPGLLIIGDAAGHIDPLTGEGIHLAMEGGAIAAETLIEGLERHNLSEDFLARYEARWRRTFGYDLWLSTQLARVYTRWPMLLDASAWAMQEQGASALLEWGKMMTGAVPKIAFLRPRTAMPILWAAARMGTWRMRGQALPARVVTA